MTEDPVLERLEITREQVLFWTRNMRPPIEPCPVNQPPTHYLYGWLRKWTSLKVSDAAKMLTDHAWTVANWNELHPDRQILTEEAGAGDTKATFYCLA